MLDQKGFDLWADGYDKQVELSDDTDTYPFAGYRKVLGEIYRIISERTAADILDVGFGTGVLTAKLYEKGYIIYGQDFSGKMVEKASKKMPRACLYQGDFTRGLAEPLLRKRYDFIVATYSLHHLTDSQKETFLSVLMSCLKDGGQLLIGDIAFENRFRMEQCRLAAGEDWDSDEYYFVADEMKARYPRLVFSEMSDCAGILILTKEPGNAQG